MKTAISIPDDIDQSADQLAKRLGMSRSELYARAVSAFIASHQNEAVTKTLNKVYSQENSNIDPNIDVMQFKSLSKEELVIRREFHTDIVANASQVAHHSINHFYPS